MLIACCDGLSGFPEAVEATWPQAMVQTCTVHLIRSAMRFVSYGDRKKVAAALRPVYTAPTAEAALMELEAFAASDLGRRYPASVQAWERAWDRFTPFLEFPPAVRKIIYTTDEIVKREHGNRRVFSAASARRGPGRRVGLLGDGSFLAALLFAVVCGPGWRWLPRRDGAVLARGRRSRRPRPGPRGPAPGRLC